MVRTVHLDDFLTNIGVSELDLLKVEAEGFEPEVLQGAERILHKIRFVSVDCGPERMGIPTLRGLRRAFD